MPSGQQPQHQEGAFLLPSGDSQCRAGGLPWPHCAGEQCCVLAGAGRVGFVSPDPWTLAAPHPTTSLHYQEPRTH